MIDSLITSKTRIKLLLKFFLNSDNRAYLRGLEGEFGDSSNSIRLELNRLEKANMLSSSTEGNRKIFSVNKDHPLYNDITSIVRKYFGLDVIVDHVAKKMGDLQAVYLIGQLAQGLDSNIIDLVFVGDINKSYLVSLIDKAEALINRKIKFIICDEKTLSKYIKDKKTAVLMWNSESTHV